MAIIKVRDIAFGRLQAPDLDAEEEFLVNFGMVRQERTRNALYMRGTGPAHHLHVTHLGDKPKFNGFAYHAQSEEDLKRIAKAPGASGIEHIDEPGGGMRVRLTEPNGFQIEVVHGIAPVTSIQVERQPINWRETLYERTGDLMRLERGPAHVMRIGHGVLGAPDVKKTVAWFRETLGMVRSDDVYVGDKDNIVGAFSRCDNGDFVCRPPRVLLRPQSDGRAQPPLLRGRGHRRRVPRPRAHARGRQVQARLGRRPASAGKPGLRLLG